MTVDQKQFFDTPAISVSALTRSAKVFLEQRFPLQWVQGEISNFTRAASGHWYFTLKDEFAQVRCTFFRARNQWQDWQPREGMAVEVRALVTLYEARAEFQLNVQGMRQAGRGALYEAFEKLKARLAAEGLFAAERKRPLPQFAKCIGIITSPAAAALRDVITTLRRRMPMAAVILYPTPVQGDGAAARMAAAIRLASLRAECDVLIVCRGGGSIEDLWCCNEEIVARAIAASQIPIISGIGHETDFTIADFVADVRAPTPTGAAELASIQSADLRERLFSAQRKLRRALDNLFDRHQQTLDHFERRLVDPRQRITQQRMRLAAAYHALQRIGLHRFELARHELNALTRRMLHQAPDLQRARSHCEALKTQLAFGMERALNSRTSRIAALCARLEDLNPRNVLRRGYAIVANDAGVVTDAQQLAQNDRVRIQFGRGRAEAAIEKIHPDELS